MNTADIKITYLALFALFLIPFIIISFKFRLNLVKKVIISSFRMIVQLSFVGIYLKYIFRYNNAIVNVIYLIIMILVATFSVLNSSGLKIQKMFIPVFFSMLIPFTVILIFFNSAVLRLDYLFEAKYLVTIGGMMLGNCLRGNIIAMESFFSGVKREEKIYLYSVSLGGSRYQALFPFIKNSIASSVNPTIASMATIGLVALPGMMTGQILGGSSPVMAIKYQIAIMSAIFFNQFFSVILSVLFAVKSGFDDFDILRKDVFR